MPVMTVPRSATASAPASIGNVIVGFDILGLSLDAARDRVMAVREEERGVRLGDVSGLVTSLPGEACRNTALAAAAAVLDAAGAGFGVRLSIDKGVPMSAGMGGSAASAVAGAVAVNALLDRPYSLEELFPFCLEGERVASDPVHWDNVMASLMGGLVLGARAEPMKLASLPVPAGLTTILFHPAAKIETQMARGILKPEVPMELLIEQSRRLAAFIAGCTTGNLDLIRDSFEDVLIEPQRAHLLPQLPAVQAAARKAGALGCSFSGSGPSVFAWATDEDAAAVEDAMREAFLDAGLAARVYRAPLDSAGARVEPVAEAVR